MQGLHDVKKSLCLFTIFGILTLLEVLCFSKLIFVSSRYIIWRGQTKFVIPALARIINVLHIRSEVIGTMMLLRKLEAIMLQQICLFPINAGFLLVTAGKIIMLLIMGCLTAICKFCSRQMRYYRLREILAFVVIGFFIILHSWGVLLPAIMLRDYIQQQVLRFGLSLLGSHAGTKSLRQRVFVGNPAFGGRGQGIRRKLRGGNKTFDSTLGFPGEGWDQLSMATWNTRSLTFERFHYCKNLVFDALAITELWRNQHKYQTKSTRFITSSPKLRTRGPDAGKMRFPADKAAGVGILLSPRTQRKLMSFGSEGERVCWVRIKGPVCNLFIVAVYLPHRGRVQPNQDDTLRDLELVLAKVPRGDCVCIMGDLNEQLEGGVASRTGRWVAGQKSANADKIMQLMQLHELTAVNTTFQPKRKSALYTYLQTKCKDQGATSDHGEHVGATVRTRYKGQWYEGRVMSTFGNNNTQKWVVKYTDNYVRHYTRKQLENILVRSKRAKIGKQIDYILVSTRWKSCVVNCSTRWQPSIHRDIHGEKNDHALVQCTWKWRIRTIKPKLCRDLHCLYTQEKIMKAFEDVVESKLTELRFSARDDSTTDMYCKICSAINHAIEETVPTKVRKQGTRREVSDATKHLFAERDKLRGQGTKEQYDDVQSKIKASSLKDFEHWVSKWSDTIEIAAGKGDTRKVYDAVKVLACKREKPSPNITTDQNGNTLKCAEEIAKAWNTFLTSKFAATDAEKARPEPEALPCTQGADDLTDEQFARGLAKMSNNKACGQDGIPSEIYKRSDKCRDLLRLLLQKIWREEDVPVDFARATFVMLYKNKGSSNDPTKYRCIGLLTHAYKVMVQCLLEKLESETASFLSEWQSGFRKERGCRDNVLTLRTLCDEMLEQGETLYVTYIDYSAAFDTISHKFLDRALKKAGASDKSRALFRAIYARASAVTKVASTDGSDITSEPFPIRRGVIQGDITSPLYFILALDLILREHDVMQDKGIIFGGERVHTLGYADDAALLDNRLKTATARVTAISQGSKRDADMTINIKKTEVMHVKEPGRVSPLTAAEAKGVCKHACPHDGCRKTFFNAHGCKVHAGRCRWRDMYVVDKILAVRGATGSPRRRFLIRWQGYGPEYDTWEPRKNLRPGMVNDFLRANGLYEHNWPGARCPLCDMPCKSERGVKIHMRSCLLRPDDEQNFAGTCAAAKVKQNKLTAAQDAEPSVKCEDKTLKNIFLFKYLGSIFAADGSQVHDVKRRIAMAMNRMGQLRHVFNADIPLNLKMKIYKTAVCSLLTYGCEAWHLDEKTTAMINGANARCLSRFTGKDTHMEASARTRSYDLVHAIRKRRFKWLVHILRMPESRLVKLATRVQHAQNMPGNMFMDIPGTHGYEEICKLANNRKIWKQMSCHLDSKTVMLRYARLYLETHASPSMSPRTRRRALRNPATPPTTPPTPETMTATTTETTITAACAARRYRAREAHEAFFRPRSKMTKAKGKKVSSRKSKKKPKRLTDKQRSAWAHADYIIKHGSAADAMRFLGSARATAVEPDVFNQLYRMRTGFIGAQIQSTSTTTSPPGIPTSPSTPTTPQSLPRVTTAGKNAKSPSPLPNPTILGHHYSSLHSHITITPQHTYPHNHTILSLSPITHTRINVYQHTMYDPHHITIMNDTYLYINNPTHTK